MRDNMDLMVQRLGALVDVLEQREFGRSVTNVEENVNRDVTSRRRMTLIG